MHAPRPHSPGAIAAGTFLALVALSACSPIGNPTAAMGAFVESASKPDRSMDLQATGRVQLAGLLVNFNAQYEWVGRDVIGSSAVSTGEMGLEQGLALVQGYTVTVFGDKAWSLDDRAYAAPDPFNLVTLEDVQVVGTERREERELVRLRINEPAAAAGALATYGNPVLSTLLIGTFAYDLYVTADGTPVLADVSVNGMIGGELAGPVESQLTLRFQGWGGIQELDLPFKVESFPEGTTFVADNAFTEPLVWRDAAGFEMLVPACSRRATDAFDGWEFDVRFAADDAPITHAEATADGPYRYSMEGASTSATDQQLPIIGTGSAMECSDRNG